MTRREAARNRKDSQQPHTLRGGFVSACRNFLELLSVISVHDDPDTQTRVSGLSPGSSRSVLPAEKTSLRSQSGSDQLGTHESAHELGTRLLHTARKHTGDRAENRRLSVRHPARSTSSAWPPVLYPTPGKTPLLFPITNCAVC